MKRSATTLVATLVFVLLPVTVVFAGGGFGAPPPDRTDGPSLNVSVVMDATKGPDPTPRQFSVSVERGTQSRSVMFLSTRSYQYGCLQDGFPSLAASTDQRFLGFLSNWAPFDAVAALVQSAGDPAQAVIVEILTLICTTVESQDFGHQEYLSFTGRIRFAR